MPFPGAVSSRASLAQVMDARLMTCGLEIEEMVR
jgi:hypothetical protein